MNPWILLAISICLEIVATNLLKVSDGFTKLLPTVGSLALYAISFYFVSIVFRTLSVGLVYAIWSGVGIVLTAIVAYFAFGQKIDTLHKKKNFKANSLFHTVKYKNHSVGYIFHTVGYKSRTVKQRIL